MYENTLAKVSSPDGETGDTLAPYIFVFVVDYALRKAIEGEEEELGFHLVKRRSRGIGPDVVTDLDFADDIAFISEDIDQE